MCGCIYIQALVGTLAQLRSYIPAITDASTETQELWRQQHWRRGTALPFDPRPGNSVSGAKHPMASGLRFSIAAVVQALGLVGERAVAGSSEAAGQRGGACCETAAQSICEALLPLCLSATEPCGELPPGSLGGDEAWVRAFLQHCRHRTMPQ